MLPPVFADKPTSTTTTTTSTTSVACPSGSYVSPFGGCWSISFSQGTCPGSGAWPTYPKDGGGFANPPSTALDPVVSNGQTICTTLTSVGNTGNPASQIFWVKIAGGNTPYPSPAYLFTTDSHGSGSASFSWTASWATGACTVTIRVAEGISTTSAPAEKDFGGNIADHYANGDPTCAALVTPVFPLGTILAVLAPLGALGAFVLAKKRQSFF